ncbi:endochitinase A-like [Zingiber officinale]|nr:endochitinase A-like [Zingiber officinale]XP_042465308.1 endochitinase A-like [Zingiber officinale]
MKRSSGATPASLSGLTVTKGVDEELALFLEMRKLEKERNNLLLHNSEDLDPPLGSKPGTAPIFKIASSPPMRKPGIDDFLNSDGEKNDYDWLLTPPGTPLFPSLDTESKRSPIGSIDTPKERPKVLKSRLSNAPDPSKNTSLRQPTSSSGINSSTLGTRRPSSSGGPSHSASRSATPDGRPASSKPTRSSTPTSRATLPSKPLAPPRSSTPVRSSTPTSRPSVPAVSKTASRSTTPTRRSSISSAVPATSMPARQPSSVSRPGPTISRSPVPTISKSSILAISKSPAPSRGSSPTLKPKPLKPSDIPGFCLDAPANLKTSLPGRSSSATRGRPGAPSSRSSSVESAPAARPRRQSCSPSRGRSANGTVMKGSSVPPPNRQQAGLTDNVNPVAMGNKMVERIVNMRRLAPPKQDDQQSTQNSLPIKSSLTPDSAGFGRTLSKKSLDMALRHMDIRRSVPNNLRPLMANIPASSVYSVRSGSSRSRAVSITDSPLATGSPASSERSISNYAICLDAGEIEDDVTSEKIGRHSAIPSTR